MSNCNCDCAAHHGRGPDPRRVGVAADRQLMTEPDYDQARAMALAWLDEPGSRTKSVDQDAHDRRVAGLVAGDPLHVLAFNCYAAEVLKRGAR